MKRSGAHSFALISTSLDEDGLRVLTAVDRILPFLNELASALWKFSETEAAIQIGIWTL